MLKFLVNNREVSTELAPGSSLVDFLRDHLHLYGTKIGCREGDCGACTVLVGQFQDGELRYQAMTSCLTPLGNAQGKHIVTIEGINQAKLTRIQEEFVAHSGTQCGFCTPGFILSLYAFCLGDQPFTMTNAVSAIAGNICRCTGYKAIERSIEPIVAQLGQRDPGNPLQWLVDQNFLPAYFTTIPARLKALAEAAPAPAPAEPGGTIIAGGTDLLIQDFHGVQDAPRVNLVAGARQWQEIHIDAQRCTLGAACTITQLKQSKALNEVLPNLDAYLDLMASTPIRNMATVGGNIANGSPIGDLAVMLLALDATLVLSHQGQRRELKLREFALGYKRVAKAAEEVIEQVWFDRPGPGTRFSFEKTSKRIHLDMATVNSALCLDLEQGIIRKAAFAVGGLGPTLRHLAQTSAYLEGQPISNATFAEANRIAQSEITPRSRAEYKRSLVRQHLLIHLMNFAPESISLDAVK